MTDRTNRTKWQTEIGVAKVCPSDKLNRFVHFVIWNIFWFVLRQHTIGQMDRHCHPLFHFVISYGLYNPSFGLTNWIDLFILSFGKISDLCWDSIQLVRWTDIAIPNFILSFRTDCTIRHLVWPTESICSFCHLEKFLICAETAYNLVRWTDIAIRYFFLSFRTDCTIRHFVWPTESICSFCHLEKFLICAETAYNWSDGQTLPSAISFCHFIRIVQSVIWSDQLNWFVHFVICKNFWFVLRQAYNWSDGQTLPSPISVCHFVRYIYID